MSHGDFDENHWDSWYFKTLTLEQSTRILRNEKTGAFLVRDSTRTPGGYVLCVKEEDEVAQYVINCKLVDAEKLYYIREESSFPDVPKLLSFYKRNLFKTTPLIFPVKRTRYDVNSAPPSLGPRDPVPGGCSVEDDEEPCYAVVTKMQVPSPYNNRALQLTVGSIIKVTKRCQSGQWEGEINGKRGSFPFTHVEMLPDGQSQT